MCADGMAFLPTGSKAGSLAGEGLRDAGGRLGRDAGLDKSFNFRQMRASTLSFNYVSVPVSHAWNCDDVETMPFFASPEAYKSRTDPTDVDDLGPIVREERNWLIRKVLQRRSRTNFRVRT